MNFGLRICSRLDLLTSQVEILSDASWIECWGHGSDVMAFLMSNPSRCQTHPETPVFRKLICLVVWELTYFIGACCLRCPPRGFRWLRIPALIIIRHQPWLATLDHHQPFFTTVTNNIHIGLMSTDQRLLFPTGSIRAEGSGSPYYLTTATNCLRLIMLNSDVANNHVVTDHVIWLC